MDVYADKLEPIRAKILEIFEHLHRHPELSWQEVETTRFLEQRLREMGFCTTLFDDCTGVVGEIGSGTFTVGLRADMDALWQEVDGEFRPNHSCGHDAHMTMVLGAAMLLKEMGWHPEGKLKLIFQPAEEKGTGALKMVEKGVVDDVHYLYGVHLRPYQEVPNGKAAPAILNGAAQFIAGEIIGEDAHGARPHLGVNAIEVGASLVNEISRIHLDPMVPYSVKLTRFSAGGESGNIIPGRARFSIDMRAQTNQAMDALVQRVQKIVRALSELYEVEIPLSFGARVAAAEVADEAREIMAQAIADVLGKENLVDPVVTPGGEDFHFYTLERPHVKATMLGLGCDLRPGLHHPQMTFDRESLFAGIEILARAVILTFEKYAKKGDSEWPDTP